MMSAPESSVDHLTTDYKLCVYCQTQSSEKLVNTQYRTFKDSAYQTLLDYVQKKAEFGNPEYIRIKERLGEITIDDLKAQKTTWHRDCHKRATSHVGRDEARQKAAVSMQDTTILTNRKRGRPSTSSNVLASNPKRTRLSTATFDKTKCIFCYQTGLQDVNKIKQNEKLSCCLTVNMGKKVQDIVKNSENSVWEVRLGDVLSPGDLVSRDIMYHHSCFTKKWEKLNLQRTSQHPTSIPEKMLNLLQQKCSFLASSKNRLMRASSLIS